MSRYNQGPWRIGALASVVCDTPVENGVPGTSDVEHYGGYLICETVSLPNALLIAAAPDLLEACKKALDYLQRSDVYRDGDAYPALIQAITKAEGTND